MMQVICRWGQKVKVTGLLLMENNMRAKILIIHQNYQNNESICHSSATLFSMTCEFSAVSELNFMLISHEGERVSSTAFSLAGCHRELRPRHQI